MKKSLLLGLVMTAFSALSVSAYEANEYVYSPTGRYQIADPADNLIPAAAAGFTDMSLWTVKTEGTVAGDFFDVAEDEELGCRKIVSTNANATNGLSISFQCSAGTSYVVSFKMKATTALTTTAAASETAGCNYINLQACTVSDTVSCGSALVLGTEWQTYCFSYTDETGATGVLSFYGMTIGVEIADVQVQAASKVFDKRLGEKSVKYAQDIKNTTDWVALGVTDFDEMISSVTDLDDSTDPETGETTVAGLDDYVAATLAEKTEEYFSTIGSGNTSADWYNWTNSYSVSSSGSMTSGGGWTFLGSRFGNRTADAAGNVLTTTGRDIWSQIPGYYAYPTSTATRDDKLAPGRYIMTLRVKGWRMSGIGSSTGNYTAYPQDGAMKFQMFYEGDTLAVQDLQVSDYTNFVYAFTVPQEKEGQTSHYGFLTFRDVADNLGGNANYNTPRLYMISTGGPSLAQLAWYEKVQTQRDAFQNAYNSAQSYVGDKNLPWMQTELVDTMAKLKPFLDKVQAIDKQTIYDDSETKLLYDSIMNYGVRPMQYFNRDFLQKNLPFTELKAAIADANSTYADPLYAAYDIAAYKKAIEGVEAKYAEIRDRQTSEFNEADSLELRAQQQILIDAKETMKKSLEPVTVVDIDFANAATADDAGVYSVAGNKGSMVFSSFAVWDATTSPGVAETYSTSKTWVQGYWDGTTKVNEGVLRIGKGDGTVTIDDADMPKRDEAAKKADIVTITFDEWVGYLMSRSVGFELQDATNTKIGRFYVVTNTGVGDDDFSGDTKLYSVYKSLGNSKTANSALCVDGNKSQFEIVLNYADNTMKCTLTTPNGTVTTPATAMLSTNPLKKFVLTSNYDNGDRRSWFDNLKISVTKNGAIIPDEPEYSVYDVNKSGAVDLADLKIVVDVICGDSSSEFAARADVNDDKTIDVLDVNAVIANIK